MKCCFFPAKIKFWMKFLFQMGRGEYLFYKKCKRNFNYVSICVGISTLSASCFLLSYNFSVAFFMIHFPFSLLFLWNRILSTNNSKKHVGITEYDIKSTDPHVQVVHLAEPYRFIGVYKVKFTDNELISNETFCKGISDTVITVYCKWIFFFIGNFV